VVSLEDIAALLILDMSPSIAWRRILEERAKRHLPVVFMVHDVLPLTNPEWFTGGENARRNFRVYIQQGLFAADVVIVASEMVKTDLENLGWRIPGRIVVVPLGSIHTPRPPSQEVNGRISMLSVTTLEPRKGHSRLLDAFDILRSQNVDVDLTLVGRPGWNSDDLFRRIRQHEDFGGRLTWFPSASDQRVISYAAQSNIGVLPADGEGFGMFFEEALSLGLKVVASDIPVFREREQKNVFYAGRTGAEFAAAILNAANTSWKPFRRGEIRSMRDFAGEIQDVILEEISRGSGNSLPAQTGEV
jgi:glycosyltransferase involved in cell wall biosynthesis